MKFLIVALCIAGAYAAVDESQSEVLRNEYELSPDGSYKATYETSNGIVASAEGSVVPIDKDQVALRVQGSSSYQSPDGETMSLSYVADENGFQPQASYLPTTPEPMPIPEYIARAIEYIQAHPYEEKKL